MNALPLAPGIAPVRGHNPAGAGEGKHKVSEITLAMGRAPDIPAARGQSQRSGISIRPCTFIPRAQVSCIHALRRSLGQAGIEIVHGDRGAAGCQMLRGGKADPAARAGDVAAAI